MDCVLNQVFWAHPEQYPGYTYYKSNDPNDLDMPTPPPLGPDIVPASDPFDWYAFVSGVKGLVQGGYALAKLGIEDWIASRASIMTLGLVTGDEAADILTAMGRPPWAKTANGLCTWVKQELEAKKTVLTPAQADALAAECKRLGVKIRLDPPQEAWGPHFNVGDRGFHAAVPAGYDNPSVPKGK